MKDRALVLFLLKEIEAQQAKLDSLMLEFCPDEMTTEQIEEWASHQKPVKDAKNFTEEYMTELVKTASNSTKSIFKDSCNHTQQAIDYFETVLLSNIESN